MSDTTASVTVTDDDLWRDAWRIAWVGAANPTAVAGAIQRALSARTRELGSRDAGSHPAIQAMFGHLGFLIGAEGYTLGPSDASLSEVRANAVRLGLIDESGNYLG